MGLHERLKEKTMTTFENWLLLLSVLHLFSLPKIIIKALRRLETEEF